MGRSIKRRLAAGLCLSTALFGAAACGSDDEDESSTSTTAAASAPETTAADDGAAAWQEIVEAAEGEGAVTLYTTAAPATIDTFIAAFNAEYPNIEVTFFRGTSTELRSKVEAEQAAGRVEGDVLTMSSAFFMQGQADDDLIIPVSEDAPNLELWDAEQLVDGNNYLSAEAIVMAYNTDVVTPAPESLDDLLSGDYDGRAGIGEIGTAEVAHMAYDLFGEENRQQLSELNPRVFNVTTEMNQAVASGEIAFAVNSPLFTLLPLQAQGAPVDYLIPATGDVPLLNTNFGVLANSPHPNAAHVLMDFILSEAGQTVLVGETGISFINAELDGGLDVDASISDRFVSLTDPKYADPAFQEEQRAEFDSLFR